MNDKSVNDLDLFSYCSMFYSVQSGKKNKPHQKKKYSNGLTSFLMLDCH